jgi:DNA-binding FadR family transcriptional regulator
MPSRLGTLEKPPYLSLAGTMTEASARQAGEKEVPLRRSKMAEIIARRIEDRIVAEGWQVGHPLGSEADLAAEEQVSRWTFREAIALLEHNGLVESRRGSGGGLFVASQLSETVCTSLSNYIVFVRTPASELVTAIRAVETLLIEKNSGHIDVETFHAIETAAKACDDPSEPAALRASAKIRPLLIGQIDNPALTLTAGVMASTIMQAAWYSRLDDDAFPAVFLPIIEATKKMAFALLDGRTADAFAASADYVAGCELILRNTGMSDRLPGRAGSAERAYRLYPAGRPVKKAERVARELRELVIDAGWPVGMSLGTQAELMAKFGVGRPVLREALRSLERLGVIESGRGGASGVKVISPNPVEIVAACKRYLRRERMTPSAAQDVLEAIERRETGGWLTADEDEQPRTFIPLLKAILAPS